MAAPRPELMSVQLLPVTGDEDAGFECLQAAPVSAVSGQKGEQVCLTMLPRDICVRLPAHDYTTVGPAGSRASML